MPKTRVTQHIKAPRSTVFRALLDAQATITLADANGGTDVVVEHDTAVDWRAALEKLAARLEPRAPQDLEPLLIERQRAGDVDGMMALFEPDATLDTADGRILHGASELREFFASWIAAGRKFQPSVQRPATIAGELALTSARGPDGIQTAEVARRQADGTWRWVIDCYAIEFP